MIDDILKKYSDSDLQLIKEYLEQRMKSHSEKSGLGVVYDITYWCNLRCKGCAVNAKYKSTVGYLTKNEIESTTKQVFSILKKIDGYVKAKGIKNFFLNFGGGEPFLRNDFYIVLEEASKLFGKKNIGVDTNGTLIDINGLQMVHKFTNYFGVSLDGMAEYHNWWRGRKSLSLDMDIFEKTVLTIKNSVAIPEVSKILEVSTVITTSNKDEISKLIYHVHSLGVKKYSIHRAMPVGRFGNIYEMLPTIQDYFDILLTIAKATKELKMNIHFHHTIESIYSTLLLGKNTYKSHKIGEPDKRSSIGIDPVGKVYFDPWCMVFPWNRLSGNSLIESSNTLEKEFSEGMLDIAQQYSLPDNRCLGCIMNCSGGSRIAAAVEYVHKSPSLKLSGVTESHILQGLVQRDPACPNEETLKR